MLMLKKYLIINLMSGPLHFVVCILLIFGMFMTSEPDTWFNNVNKALIYLFWFGMIPNVVYLFKNWSAESNFVSFIVSSVILYIVYFAVVNFAGWLYFHKIF
ncbi:MULTISPECIES: hypothetical protein [Bacillaceae]|uniref:Uncharacterized protein n=1 Tax=Evansella alkalicola TaxID=745819 RepID=A0ABS6JZQ1_9BACI|nr:MULTISPECIES: hypothetical protein [Bacillaceae]MBU9723697.1 hypothetical protein [Bacillus alkalicola]